MDYKNIVEIENELKRVEGVIEGGEGFFKEEEKNFWLNKKQTLLEMIDKKKLVTDIPLEWKEVEELIRRENVNSVGELSELRNKIVEDYESMRAPLVDRGRLSDEAMDNLMLVTTVIDTMIMSLGGQV